jgi:hypothetical protein
VERNEKPWSSELKRKFPPEKSERRSLPGFAEGALAAIKRSI